MTTIETTDSLKDLPEGQHTPTPWKAFADGYRGHEILTHDNGTKSIGYIYGKHDADFVLKACNSHDGLIEKLGAIVKAFHTFAEHAVRIPIPTIHHDLADDYRALIEAVQDAQTSPALKATEDK